MPLPQEGKKAPAFSMPASTGNVVSLKDFIGKKVVLYFYPKDNTPGCTTEACNFRDSHQDFEKLDAVVLGVSPDGVGSHERFITKHDLPFILLADEDHQVAEKYGVWGEKSLYGKKFMGIQRSTFVIDRKGNIAKIFSKVKVTSHHQEVLAALKELD